MKQKLILTCAAAAVPALLYALYFYRCSVC